jgi:hypothetical protein
MGTWFCDSFGLEALEELIIESLTESDVLKIVVETQLKDSIFFDLDVKDCLRYGSSDCCDDHFDVVTL